MANSRKVFFRNAPSALRVDQSAGPVNKMGFRSLMVAEMRRGNHARHLSIFRAVELDPECIKLMVRRGELGHLKAHLCKSATHCRASQVWLACQKRAFLARADNGGSHEVQT